MLEAQSLSASFGTKQVLFDVNLKMPEQSITALIGPSGCGKSTFLRCLNRLHEETPEAKVQGQVIFNGVKIYNPKVSPVELRARIGMVFQKPNPFPSLSVFENVASGLRIRGIIHGAALASAVEQALVEAQLWDEVKDSLHRPATRLSGGQQQRLCIARALALRPPYLVLDEPTSALDPISTAKIEELLVQLKAHHSIVLVTHNLAQAKRVADQVAFFLNGRIIESGTAAAVFNHAVHKETRDYVEGRFG